MFNLRTDPYERADITSNTYYDWFLYHAYFIYVAQTAAMQFAETFVDFPPAQLRPQLHHRRRDGEDARGRQRRAALGRASIDAYGAGPFGGPASP